jgi:hypothetical protein
MTLNQVIKELNTIASAHLQINTFGFGDVSDIAASGDVIYPLMFAMLDGVDVSDGVESVKFSLVFCDIVKQGEVNETEVLSDQREIAKDVLSQLEEDIYDWQFESNGVTLQPFTDRWTDSVSGYVASIVLQLPFISDRCSIPMTSISGSTSGNGTIVNESGIIYIYIDGVLNQTVFSDDLSAEILNINLA